MSVDEVRRFLRHRTAVIAYRGSRTLRGARPEWYQGPFADALTHVGQLAMLRRMSGAPMKGESYVFADIRAGHVGVDQFPPQERDEFD